MLNRFVTRIPGQFFYVNMKSKSKHSISNEGGDFIFKKMTKHKKTNHEQNVRFVRRESKEKCELVEEQQQSKTTSIHNKFLPGTLFTYPPSSNKCPSFGSHNLPNGIV